MALTTDIINVLSLLFHGKWREFIFRTRVHLQKIDLKNTYLDELNLPEDRCHYYANSGGPHLDKVLKALKITAQDCIVDFGSGKGGALITLSRYPFARISGVEISPELAVIAKQNLHKFNIRNVTMNVCDAADFIELDEYNYFYFFSPFPAAVMSAVIRNICASLTNNPRKASIIYFNPECHDAVVTDSPFVKINEFNHHELKFYIYSNRP
ncbi:MAG: class I SAM-dependent methyltransferase [Desulfuromonadaceae bacterium]